MAKYSPVHGPARLRQRGGDRILYVTDHGTTYSGHVYNTSWTMTSGEFPTVELELSNGWPTRWAKWMSPACHSRRTGFWQRTSTLST